MKNTDNNGYNEHCVANCSKQLIESGKCPCKSGAICTPEPERALEPKSGEYFSKVSMGGGEYFIIGHEWDMKNDCLARTIIIRDDCKRLYCCDGGCDLTPIKGLFVITAKNLGWMHYLLQFKLSQAGYPADDVVVGELYKPKNAHKFNDLSPASSNRFQIRNFLNGKNYDDTIR